VFFESLLAPVPWAVGDAAGFADFCAEISASEGGLEGQRGGYLFVSLGS
jgi:hypothetical protein